MPQPWLDVKPLCGSFAPLRPYRVMPTLSAAVDRYQAVAEDWATMKEVSHAQS